MSSVEASTSFASQSFPLLIVERPCLSTTIPLSLSLNPLPSRSALLRHVQVSTVLLKKRRRIHGRPGYSACRVPLQSAEEARVRAGSVRDTRAPATIASVIVVFVKRRDIDSYDVGDSRHSEKCLNCPLFPPHLLTRSTRPPTALALPPGACLRATRLSSIRPVFSQPEVCPPTFRRQNALTLACQVRQLRATAPTAQRVTLTRTLIPATFRVPRQQ